MVEKIMEKRLLEVSNMSSNLLSGEIEVEVGAFRMMCFPANSQLSHG
jgi:hypothetical protein